MAVSMMSWLNRIRSREGVPDPAWMGSKPPRYIEGMELPDHSKIRPSNGDALKEKFVDAKFTPKREAEVQE